MSSKTNDRDDDDDDDDDDGNDDDDNDDDGDDDDDDVTVIGSFLVRASGEGGLIYNMPNKLKIYKSSSKHHAFVTKNPAYMDNH